MPTNKFYFVDCTVLFSEEEQAIIRARGLGQHFFVVGSETAPSPNSHRTLGVLLQVFSPVLLLGGCTISLGMAIAGKGHVADSIGGFSLIAGMTMYLSGLAWRRHVRNAEQPQQQITLNRLLSYPKFSIYAFDNATAKTIDADLRDTLANVKAGLGVNARVAQPESFEL